MIKSFETISNKELVFCGGKGKNLVLLSQKSFNVPSGFIISYDEFDKENWEERLFAFFDTYFHNNETVIVRSSALCEDGERFSWSGVFESIPSVHKNELISAIRRCRESAKSKTALAYAAYTKTNQIHMSVIIQKQIDSEISGVCFSHNPVTGECEQIIEYVDGNGEQLVSGLKTPNKVSFHSFNQTFKSESEDNLIKLDNELLYQILKIAKQLFDIFVAPVDYEWTIKQNELFILQCRPITTIKDK